MKPTSLSRNLVFAFLVIFPFASAEQVLINAGQPFSTPGLGLLLPNAQIDGEDIIYRRIFYIDKKQLPRPIDYTKEGELPITAKKAINLVLQRDTLPEQTIIKRLEQLTQTTPDGREIDYYIIEYEHNRSTEYRVVLMNSIVLAPTLEKVPPPGK